MGNYKWGEINEDRTKPLKVCLFISRNKDNREIANYKERRRAFLTRKTPEELSSAFDDFVNKGLDGEFCRMYISVNARDESKIKKQLIHYLIDDENVKLVSIEAKVAGIAAQKECSAEKKWMFDFDSQDTDMIYDFVKDILECDSNVIVSAYPTPHGYAVVTNRGFEARLKDKTLLMDKWKDIVTLKKDDVLCVMWKTKTAIINKGEELCQ